MASKADAQRMSEAAKRMKEQGVKRLTGLCPVCYRMVSVPMDRHFFGGSCS